MSFSWVAETISEAEGMNLYREAEEFLVRNSRDGSLQTSIFNASRNKQIKTDPRHLYALVSSTLRYKPFLLEIIKKSKLLKEEKRITESIALLLVHDLLFTKSGRIQMGKTPIKEAVLRHKARLSAELTKLKLKYRVRNLDELVDDDSSPVRWFRINTIKASADDALAKFPQLEKVTNIDELKEPGLIYHDEYIPNLFGVHPREKITRWKLYEDGQIIIQDRASCFPAHILNPIEGDKIIDACAAPGNKTTHLAAHVKNYPSSINAFEKDLKRSEILKKMVAKAGAENCVKINVGDFTSTNPQDYEDVTGLVVDPSCSGSGIFGRAYEGNDAEGDYNEERLQKLSSFQFSIMKHALSFPNATRVVYSTCSIHSQENERVVIDLINDFEVKKSGWKLAKREQVIPEWPRRGKHEEFEGFPNASELADGCIRSLPKIDGGIGFFAACFVKGSSEASEDGDEPQESEEVYEEWNGFN